MIHPMIEKVAEKLRRHRLNSFEHQATATIRAALEYARDNVSEDEQAEIIGQYQATVIRDYLTALLKEIEE